MQTEYGEIVANLSYPTVDGNLLETDPKQAELISTFKCKNQD